MIVVPVARYNQSENKFETPGTCSKDKLLPKGHQYCRAEEYHLGNNTYVDTDSAIWLCGNQCILFIECVGGEQRFYILTPIDIILAEVCSCTSKHTKSMSILYIDRLNLVFIKVQ